VRAWQDDDRLVLAEFSGHLAGERGQPRTIGALVEAGGASSASFPAPAHETAKPFRGGLSAEQFRRVVDYMDQHLQEDVTLEQLSGVAGFSPFHFQRAFKRQTGATPQGYLLRMRVQRAKNMLFGTSRPLAQIAQSVGYGTSQAFARAFSRAESMTPAEFRRRMRG
jgi:transcriptional regulator GlxA family with amidase domain